MAHRLNHGVWSAWIGAGRLPGDAALRGELLRALERLDTDPVAGWRDPLMFLGPMDETVAAARYWQSPDERDVVAADPAVVERLRPVAAAIAAAPGAAWWTTPADPADLRYTSRFDTQRAVPPPLTGAAQQLADWRIATLADNRRAATERSADPAAPFSGRWWSTPTGARLVTTTRRLPGLGSIKLAWEDDSFNQSDAAIWSLRTSGEPRMWEVDGPDAWTRLDDRYPLDVTHGRRHDWYRATGRDGSWRIPDWDAVAADWDGVHLTVAGYLSTATRALQLADATAATVLAGWDPDQTWWLTDCLAAVPPQPEMWHNATSPDMPTPTWHRVSWGIADW